MSETYRNLNDIFSEVAYRHGVRTTVVKEIYNFIFKYIREKITTDEMPSILINGLGTFYVKPARLEIYLNKEPGIDKEQKEKLEIILDNKLKNNYG